MRNNIRKHDLGLQIDSWYSSFVKGVYEKHLCNTSHARNLSNTKQPWQKLNFLGTRTFEIDWKKGKEFVGKIDLIRIYEINHCIQKPISQLHHDPLWDDLLPVSLAKNTMIFENIGSKFIFIHNMMDVTLIRNSKLPEIEERYHWRKPGDYTTWHTDLHHIYKMYFLSRKIEDFLHHDVALIHPGVRELGILSEEFPQKQNIPFVV